MHDVRVTHDHASAHERADKDVERIAPARVADRNEDADHEELAQRYDEIRAQAEEALIVEATDDEINFLLQLTSMTTSNSPTKKSTTSQAKKTWPGKLKALPTSLRRAAILQAAERRGLKVPEK